MKKYEENQAEKTKLNEAPKPTDVACAEVKCDGEMLWTMPKKQHTELKSLYRAVCGTCGWKGWV